MFESMSKQELFLNLWRNRDERHKMSEEDRHFLKAMEDHPEMEKIWNSSSIYDSLNLENEENPFAHIAFHTIIRNQIERQDPAIVHQAYEKLTARGVPHHEAEHSLMVIMVDELFNMMKEQRQFDQKSYEKRINKFLE
jgi:hypothetical protein